MRSYYKTILRILISAVLIIVLIYTQDIDKIKTTALSFELFYLLIALVLLIIGTYISSIRWKVILKTSGVEVNSLYLFVLYLKGYFYNNFLPTQMGGDVYKSVSLGKKINNQSLSLFSVFMDRFGGLIVLLLLALFGLGSIYGSYGVLIALAIFIIGLLLYIPVLNIFASKIKFFKNFKEASDLFIKNKKSGILVLLYSLLVQVFSFATTYTLFLGLGITLPLIAVIAFMPIAALSLLIPSFNGFGTQELVYAFLFSNVGVTPEISVTASIMNHVVRLIMSLFGGMLILFNINIKTHDISTFNKSNIE